MALASNNAATDTGLAGTGELTVRIWDEGRPRRVLEAAVGLEMVADEAAPLVTTAELTGLAKGEELEADVASDKLSELEGDAMTPA